MKCPQCVCDINSQMSDGFFRCDSCQARLFGYQPINMANGSAFHVLPVDVEGYTVEELVGRGGMGLVFKGQSNTTGETVAVKFPSGNYQLEREAETLKELNLNGVVRYLAHGVHPKTSQHFIAMEFIDGVSLNRLIDDDNGLGFDAVNRIIRKVCEALQSVHDRGIVHGDIKPSNIMVLNDSKESIKILDFGIARTSTASGNTSTGTTQCTPGSQLYMAPELLRGAKPDKRSDIFALGVMYYMALNGLKSTNVSLRDISANNKPIPDGFFRLARAMMAPEPQYRPSLNGVINVFTGDKSVHDVIPSPAPKVTNNANSGQPADTYRLGIYGTRASGKTCILAAMALPRTPHPSGYECAYIEPRTINPRTGNSANKLDSFQEGFVWLNEQSRRLYNGQVPKQNPSTNVDLRFLFDISSRSGGRRRVELIDYSGELLGATASELASKMREHMNSCDGLLVLAEVPIEKHVAALANELAVLKSAFTSLMEGRTDHIRQQWPVAVLLNKWDRRGDFSAEEYLERNELVRSYLEAKPIPANKGVIDQLANTVGEENTRCFPVSAYGHGRIVEVGEDVGKEAAVLLNGMLDSKGLLEPFLWVMDRADELAAQKRADIRYALRWWAPWDLVGGTTLHNDSVSLGTAQKLNAWKCYQSMDSFFGNTSRTVAREDVRKTRNHIFSTLVGQAVVGCMYLVAMVIGLFQFYQFAEAIRYAPWAYVVINKSDAEENERRQAENWLTSYASSPVLSYVLSPYSKKYAEEMADSAKRNRQEEYKNGMEHLELLVRKTAADNYLNNFPDGLYIVTARNIQKEFSLFEDRRRIDGELNRIDQLSNNDKSNLEMLKNELLVIDPKNNSTEEQLSNAKSLLKKIETLRDLQEIRKVMKEIFDHLDKYEYEQASDKFYKNAKIALLDANRKANLIQQISDTTIKNVKISVNELMDTKSWDKAREISKAPFNSIQFKDLVQERLRENIDLLLKRIDEEEDKFLYDLIKFKRLGALNDCQNYIKNAPIGEMKKNVAAYVVWINQMQGPIPMTLQIQSIDWHPRHWARIGRYNNVIKAVVNGGPNGVFNVGPNDYTPGKSSVNVGQVQFNALNNAPVNVDIEIFSEWSLGSDTSGAIPGRIGANGKALALDPVTYNNANKVNFILVRNPPGEPNLPQWKGNAP